MLVDKYILHQRSARAEHEASAREAERVVAAVFPPRRIEELAKGWNRSAP